MVCCNDDYFACDMDALVRKAMIDFWMEVISPVTPPDIIR